MDIAKDVGIKLTKAALYLGVLIAFVAIAGLFIEAVS